MDFPNQHTLLICFPDVKNVQRQEIRQGIACVKHQNMAGSDMGDDHKEYFAGDYMYMNLL